MSLDELTKELICIWIMVDLFIKVINPYIKH